MIISIISASLAMMLSWKLSGVSGRESCSWAATQLAKHPTSRSCLTTMLRVLGASKENGGESFPDYVGALILGELDKCVALSAMYRKKEDEVAKERRTKAEAEERAFCEEENRLSEQAVQEAIRTIKDGGVLQNQTVKFYRSRYRCNAFSIVNYLMRKYGVNVPLRTQGWINEKLTSVTIENGKCEHLRYMRAKGAQCSQRFFDCMSELIHNVCAETEG